MSRGEQNIHVYRIELEPYESGIFYSRDDGILTLTTDREFPYRTHRLSIISNSSNQISITSGGATISSNTSIGTVAFRKQPLVYACGDKVVIPTFGIRDEEWDNEMTIHTVECLSSARGVYEDDNYSVFITRKKFEDNIWEAGLAACPGYGSDRFVRNRKLETYIEHLLDFDEL